MDGELRSEMSWLNFGIYFFENNEENKKKDVSRLDLENVNHRHSTAQDRGWGGGITSLP
jgi:hypothetical protein